MHFLFLACILEDCFENLIDLGNVEKAKEFGHSKDTHQLYPLTIVTDYLSKRDYCYKINEKPSPKNNHSIKIKGNLMY